MIGRMRTRRSLLAGASFALALGVLAACSPRIDQRGNRPDEDQVVLINPGVDDKNRVAELIGTPSTISTLPSATSSSRSGLGSAIIASRPVALPFWSSTA